MENVKVMGAAALGMLEALLDPDDVLADFPRRDELSKVEANTFHPLSLDVELCDYLEERLGMYAFRRISRKLAIAVMDTAFPADIDSVEEAIAAIDAAHRIFCKPLIGAFEIEDWSPREVAVRYTAPYNCVVQEGLFHEVALRYGAPSATVTHVACRRRGAPACRFEIRY